MLQLTSMSDGRIEKIEKDLNCTWAKDSKTSNGTKYDLPHAGFHTGFFPGGGKCRCVQRAHACVDSPTRVL